MTTEGPHETIRCRVIYHGRVQGVFFRATAAEIAGRHPVAGFVRNLRDGTVELEAEGPDVGVEALLRDIAGQYEGYVTTAERTTLPVQGVERRFEIRY
jgi:acylphosphatase